MKKLFLLVLVALPFAGLAQTNDYTVSFEGLGKLKNGMSQKEVEKVLSVKIPLTNPYDTITGSWIDSAKVKYKNISLKLFFQRNYLDSASFEMQLSSIQINSPLCKTTTGIGVGSDKLKIINSYETYYISVEPDFDENGKRLPSSTIYVNDGENERMLVFYLVRNKVVYFETAVQYGDGE